MAEQQQIDNDEVGFGDADAGLDRLPDDGRLSEPLTPELEAKLRPHATMFRAGRGHPTTAYVEVVRQVHETREGRAHIEREFPGVSPEHVAGNLRRQAAKHGWRIAVAHNLEDGVCVMCVGENTLIA